MSSTLVDIATEKAPTQKVMIDLLTEESPFLERLPMEPCSDDNINKFEKLTSVESAKVVKVDEPLPVVNSETELDSTTISRVGGIIRAGKNLVDMWPTGKDGYYAKKFTPVLKESGNELEQTLLYNTFIDAAIKAGNVIDAGGRTADKQNTMLFIKWGEGETNGLYNPRLVNSGKMFGMDDVGNGGTYEIYNPDTDSYDLVYGRYMESFIGAQVANSRNVFAIVNIDLSDDGADGYKNLPTEVMMGRAQTAVRARPNNTEIWAGSEVVTAMGIEYSGAQMNTRPESAERQNEIDFWNKIPMLASYNFKENAEAVVTVA